MVCLQGTQVRQPLIENIELTNFISHRETSIPLEDGVNVFVGANGAGKSSVLDALTYALYGEHTRDSARNILRRGAAGGAVSVKFGLGGREYLAQRRLGKGGKLESATFRELSPNPRLIVAGERRQYDESMSDEVTKTLGLDYGKMCVASIIHQGELDTIIRYKPKELKELINSLIGIDKLDLAYKGMYEALEGFRLKVREECMNYDDQSVDALRSEIEQTTLKQTEAQKRAVEVAIGLSELELVRKKLEEELEVLEPLKQKKKDLEERRKELVKYVINTISTRQEEAQSLADAIKKARKYLPVMATKPAVETEAQSIEEQGEKYGQAKTDLVSDLRGARNSEEHASKIRKDIGEIGERMTKRRGKIKRLKTEISTLRRLRSPTRETQDQLRTKLRTAQNEEASLRDTLTTIVQVLGNYSTIQKEGVCPTCGSTVEEINLDSKMQAKHQEHLSAKSRHNQAVRDRDSIGELLEKRRDYDTALKRMPEKKEALDDELGDLKADRQRLGSLRAEARTQSNEARKIPTIEEGLKSVELKIGSLQKRRRAVQTRHNSVVEAETWLRDNEISSKGDIARLQKELGGLQQSLKSIPEELEKAPAEKLIVDDYSEELVSRVAALSKEVSKFDELAFQAKKRELEEEIQPKIAQLTQDTGGWKAQEEEATKGLAKLNEAKANLEVASRYIHLFERIRSDVYNRDGVLATSLRSWALKELSRNASEYVRMFGIGVSELQLKEEKHDVDIECYSGSGSASVRSMSGGEGVAIALALRFAMARLMGKGMVDFVALDEPTTHLDEERRRSLVRLITEFNSDERQTSLNQIIVITHDREIFEDSEVNAVFQFEKNGGITSVTKS